jgi:hypothetical protein
VTRMMHKQSYISAEQQIALAERAKELGGTESALIRRGLDSVARPVAQPADEHAWEDALAFMRERARIESDQERRGWTREDR